MTKIVLVDDHVLFREGLVGLLDSQPGFEVIAHAGSVQEAIDLACKLAVCRRSNFHLKANDIN